MTPQSRDTMGGEKDLRGTMGGEKDLRPGILRIRGELKTILQWLEMETMMMMMGKRVILDPEAMGEMEYLGKKMIQEMEDLGMILR